MATSILPRGLRLAPCEELDRLARSDRGHVDVALLAAEIDASEGAGHANVDDVDLGSLLRLVRGECCIAGGLDLHDEERLARDEHHPLTVSVDELHLEV